MSDIDDELNSIDLHNNDTPPSFDDEDDQGGLDDLEKAVNKEVEKPAEVAETAPSDDDAVKPAPVEKPAEVAETAPSDDDAVKPAPVEKPAEVAETAPVVVKKTHSADATNKAQLIVDDIFRHTRIKITEDDPLILMMLHNSTLLQSTQAELTNAITALNTEMLQAIQSKHEDGLTALQNQHDKGLTDFNGRISYVEKLLAKLEDQKDAIIQDVWSKSQDIMYERTKTTMQKAINEMMQEGQGAVNNQRNILIGAFGGMVFGMILAAIIITFT